MVNAWGVRRTDLEGYDGVPRRTVFILDPEMKVRWLWVTSPEQRLPDTEQILREATRVAGVGAAKTPEKAPAKKSKKG
jgi:hypothetical protein